MKLTSLIKAWKVLQGIPAGKSLFGLLVSLFNPYTGALGARVCEFRPGYARIKLVERRAIRNHLNSIHAIALVNLGEFVSGLALLSTMDDRVRGIPVEIKSEFIKKARGVLEAECHTRLPDISNDVDHIVNTDILNEQGELVAKISVKWKLGLVPVQP